GSLDAAMRQIRDQLLPKVKALCRLLVTPEPPGPPPPPPPPLPLARPLEASARSRIALVAIGASTGGPNALAAVLSGLPAGFPVPIVVVQHMPPVFTQILADRLTAKG